MPQTSSWKLESENSTNELNTAIEFDCTLNQYSVQACLPVDFQTCASVGEDTMLWKLMPFTEMQLNHNVYFSIHLVFIIAALAMA